MFRANKSPARIIVRDDEGKEVNVEQSVTRLKTSGLRKQTDEQTDVVVAAVREP